MAPDLAFPRRLALLAALTALLGALPAHAQNPVTFRFTGIVTRIDDPLSVFQNTYALGEAIFGTYTFSDAGYTDGFFLTDPQVHRYDNFAHGAFSIRSGAQPAVAGNGLAITVGDNANGAVLPAGDTYQAQANLDFPSFFRDPTGDPNFDPDGFFFPFLFSSLNLYDPTGTALPAFDLPLTPPSLARFLERSGSVLLLDGNGTLPNAAEMRFRVDTLTLASAAPEPGSLGLVALGLLGLRRRRPRVAGEKA